MKLNLNKNNKQWGLTAFLVILASVVVAYFIFHFDIIISFLAWIINIFKPIIFGFLLSYLMNPILNWYEKWAIPKLCAKKNIEMSSDARRRIRKISVFLTVLTVISVVSFFLWLIIPQLVTSFQSLQAHFTIKSLSNYMDQARAWLNNFFRNFPSIESLFNEYGPKLLSQAGETLQRLMPFINQIASSVTVGILRSLTFLWNILLGLIFSVYILLTKEHFLAQSRKIFFAFFHRATANDILDELYYINKLFNTYIVSSIVDSFIIGMFCFICCLIFRIPYPVLVSVIVGVTNIIPFFGPFMGGIPCTLIILMIDPIRAVYFAILIIIIQQIDGNVIKPKLFGDSMGLSGFWVITAIMVGGGLFGVVGMYLGTPVVAIIYYEIAHRVNKRLAAKNLETATESYLKPDELPIEGKSPKKKPIQRERKKILPFLFGLRESEKKKKEAQEEPPDDEKQNSAEGKESPSADEKQDSIENNDSAENGESGDNKPSERQ